MGKIVDCVQLVNKLMWLILTNKTKENFDLKEEN